MLQITRGTNSEFVVTLKEKQWTGAQALQNPVFLFRFISEGRRSEKAFIAVDLATSDEKERANRFIITESANENLTSGIVSLTEGLYEYRVYEQTSTTNLNWNAATNTTPLEIGLAKVTGTPTDTFTKPTGTDTFTWRTT